MLFVLRITNKIKFLNRNIHLNKPNFKKTFIKKNSVSNINSEIKTTKIDIETVNHLERLSLVDCANENSLKLIENAVNFANSIINVDTSNVDPLITVAEDRPLIVREDEVKEGNCKRDILKNASITEEDYFVVPPGNVPLETEELFDDLKSTKISN